MITKCSAWLLPEHHYADTERREMHFYREYFLTHPPYSPDLAPPDFHLFGPLKESMRGIHFQTDEEVNAAVSNWLRTQSTKFYAKGIDNLISRWNKCVAKEGDYVEKFHSFIVTIYPPDSRSNAMRYT